MVQCPQFVVKGLPSQTAIIFLADTMVGITSGFELFAGREREWGNRQSTVIEFKLFCIRIEKPVMQSGHLMRHALFLVESSDEHQPHQRQVHVDEPWLISHSNENLALNHFDTSLDRIVLLGRSVDNENIHHVST